jgi:hypothetical protein
LLSNSTISGELEVEICPAGIDSTYPKATAVFIRKLDIALVPNPVAKATEGYYPTPERLYYGGYSYNNELAPVRIPLTFGFPMGPKPFSTIVDGFDYSGTTSWNPIENPFKISGSLLFTTPDNTFYGIPERIYRLANLGDGVELELPLLDAHNATDVMTAYTCDKWQGRKCIVGYIRDICNSTITVTLN